MKSLVTGGAGFIGSHLVDRLVSLGHEVVVLDNFRRGNKLLKETIARIELIEGDVREETTVARAVDDCDIVFHLAAVLGVDVVADNPVETMETEVLGARNVAAAAVANDSRKIIYASTSGVYGKAAIEQSVNEEFAVSPSSSYSIAKRYNEIYLQSLYEEKDVQSVSLRFFNVYGPRQDTRMVIPRFIEQAKADNHITVYGTGNQTRDFTHIDDVVEAAVRVADCVDGCEIINVSRNAECSIRQLAETIVELCDSRSEIKYIDAPQARYDFEVARRCGSSAKLERLTGFLPATALEAGLRTILDTDAPDS